MSKQQNALFRRALALHESQPSIPNLQQALALYEQAATASTATFPLLFNTAAVCHTLSDLIPSHSCPYLTAAENHINNALSLFPINLEALSAAATIQQSLARIAPTLPTALSHRARAVQFLKSGSDAEPTDPSIRILLAEALVEQAETAAELNHPTVPALLQHARAPVDEAVWLLDARISELSRIRTDLQALEQARRKRVHALTTRASVVVAKNRLCEGQAAAEKVAEMRAVHDELVGVSRADVLLLRAELLQGIAERGGDGAADEALVVCRQAVRGLDMEGGGEGENGVLANALLGDLCLELVRGERDMQRVAELVREGAAGYERAVRMAEGAGRPVEAENVYNMACLVVIGRARGCDTGYGERDVGEMLKRAVELGGVTVGDLRTDTDLEGIRGKAWFGRLIEFTRRARRG